MTNTTRDLAAVTAWLNQNNHSAWFAPSGEQIPGAAVAAHLEAAAQILTEDGWSADPLAVGLRIDDAMTAALFGGAGTTDTQYVAETLTEAVICSTTGALAAHYRLWEKVAGRTGEQVVQILTDTAVFARQYGPEGA